MLIAQRLKAISFQGWSPENKNNKEQIEKMKNIIESPSINSVAISGHNNPDGDSIGSSFAMAHLMNKKLGKPIDVYIFGRLPEKFNYLNQNDEIKVINVNNENKVKDKKYDLAISLDTAASNLMNPEYYKAVYINANHKLKVDHHEQNSKNEERNESYADVSLVDSNAASASELVMQFVEPLGLKPQDLPEQFNNAVYTGIITDSGNFAYARNPLVFEDSALLLKNGLKPNIVLSHINIKIPKEVNDILNIARNKVKFSDDNKIGYLYFDDELSKLIKNLNDKDKEIETNCRIKDMTSSLRNIEGVEISLLFTKTDNGLYVSSRSNDKNVRSLAERYGGGGHDKAAGFEVPLDCSPEKTISNILNDCYSTVFCE